jgi:hypothetical protein
LGIDRTAVLSDATPAPQAELRTPALAVVSVGEFGAANLPSWSQGTVAASVKLALPPTVVT